MKNLTWQNPEQLFVAQVLINKVKSKCCGIKGDKNQVRNILFEDIRVENIQEGRLFYVKVRFNEKYDKQPGSGIEGVTFRNITYTGIGENPSLIQGLDKERTVQNVTFENVVINGERMKDLKGIVTNDFIKGIKIK